MLFDKIGVHHFGRKFALVSPWWNRKGKQFWHIGAEMEGKETEEQMDSRKTHSIATLKGITYGARLSSLQPLTHNSQFIKFIPHH